MNTGGDPESELVAEFRSLAGAPMGAGSQAFEFHIQGVHIQVLHQPGSSSTLYLSAFYPDPSKQNAPKPLVSTPIQHAPMAIRPMGILLRPETPQDREAKQQGVVAELQTGDAQFDHEVFIDTKSPAQTVFHVLSSPALRAGVRALLAEGFGRVLIDDERERICADLTTFVDIQKRPGRARRILDTFAAVVLNAPYVQRSSEKFPSDTQLTWLILGTVLASILFLTGPLPYFLLVDTFCNDKSTVAQPPFSYLGGCHSPVPLGLFLGSFLGVLWGKILAGKIRGRSNSRGRASWIFIIALALSIEFTIILLCALLWNL